MRRAKRAILLMSLAAQAWSPWSFCPARLNARVGCQADRHLAGAKEDWTSAFELAASASGTKLDWLCLPCLVLLLAWPVAALSPQELLAQDLLGSHSGKARAQLETLPEIDDEQYSSRCAK
eukprot:g21750.t1